MTGILDETQKTQDTSEMANAKNQVEQLKQLGREGYTHINFQPFSGEPKTVEMDLDDAINLLERTIKET
jgi:hypothetical protein